MRILCFRSRDPRTDGSFHLSPQARTSQEGATKNREEVLSKTVENYAKTKWLFTSYVQVGSVFPYFGFSNGYIVVREYQYTEDESEDQGLSDTETTRSCDAECAGTSAIRSTVKRRGWRYALLGAVQNAVPKRSKEDKNLHTVVPRRPLSLTPFRFSHHPPGLRIRESRESLER